MFVTEGHQIGSLHGGWLAVNELGDAPLRTHRSVTPRHDKPPRVLRHALEAGARRVRNIAVAPLQDMCRT